jgi:sialic acid synthase SpsE
VKVSPDEEITKVRARRGVYAARDLTQGEILKESDFLVVRPKTSLNPDAVPLLIGQKVSKNIKKYQPVLFDCAVTSDAPNWQAAAEYWSVEMREKNIS